MSTYIVSVLNDLIEISKDGEQGFKKAEDETSKPELKAVFAACSKDCTKAVQELQGLVQKFGGKPEDSGSLSGTLHRGWIELKAAVIGIDDHALLAECERGEDVAKKHYHNALEKELPPEVRALVEAQYQDLLKNHDRIRNLRDQTASSKSPTDSFL